MFSLAKVFDFYYTTTFKSPVEWYRSPLTKPAAIAAALFAQSLTNISFPTDFEEIILDTLEFENSYVVAKLVKDNNEEYIPLSEVENKVKQNIRADKKYDKLVERMGEYSSLESLSEKLNINVISNQEAKLSSLSVDNLGYVPEFVGAIFSTDIGGVSAPIKSTNSVNVVSVISKDDYRSEGDFSLEQESMLEKIKAYSLNASYKALEDDANVVDNRSEIYQFYLNISNL